ncbi:MAG: hypothetical protein U0414_11725 [Polyangiaceae bacterium]
MGVESELLLGGVADADAMANAIDAAQAFDGIRVKGIDPVKLQSLYSKVGGKTLKLDPIAMASDEGPWVMRIPDAFVRALAKLDAPERKKVAAFWAKTEEFAMDKRWKAPAVASTLDAICALAVKAVADKKKMFLWMSL